MPKHVFKTLSREFEIHFTFDFVCLFVHRLWSHDTFHIRRPTLLYLLRLIWDTAVFVDAESSRQANKRALRKPAYFNQLQKPTQAGQEHKSQGLAGNNRTSLSLPPTWWTTLFIGGLELL